MANSTAKQPGRNKGSSHKDKQPPIRISEREQGGNSPSRQYDDQQGRRPQSQADLNDSSRRDPSGLQHPRQSGDDYEQSRQQGRNLPEGNQQRDNPRQQQQGHAAEKMKGQWQQHVGDAKVLWGKLTDDELMRTEGRADRLTGLIRERYAVSEEAAQAQVRKFYADSGYWP